MDLSYLALGPYWNELGVESPGDYPQSIQDRWNKINNIVWQKTKELKQQRKHEKDEQERIHAYTFVPEIIEWLAEKDLEKLSKINLKLFLSEKKMTLAPVNRQALYLEVNKVLTAKKH